MSSAFQRKLRGAESLYRHGMFREARAPDRGALAVRPRDLRGRLRLAAIALWENPHEEAEHVITGFG